MASMQTPMRRKTTSGRSTKHVRSHMIYVEKSLSDAEMTWKELPNPSFKDKLLGVQPLAGDQETKDWYP